MSSLQQKAQTLLAKAGVTINGPQPYDIQVHSQDVYQRAFSQGTVGLGEAYMDGQWDAPDLSELFSRLLRADLKKTLSPLSAVWYFLQARFTNMQSAKRAFEVGEKHYDLGNDLFEAMLGRTLAYTCGYWSSPTHPVYNLDQAQEAKFDLICRKVGLKPGDTILDIGCGWGMFLKFAAEKYGAKGVGITVSVEQAEFARNLCKDLPVEIRVEDYRDTTGQFDRIISIGMFEHVGLKNYRTYMEKAASLLKEDGIFLLHTIGGNYTKWTNDPWIEKYIFPNGILPSPKDIGTAIDKVFVLEDWHNFGPDYDKTLCAWFKNFDAAWPTLKATGKYDERFYRMWKYYLLSCAGSFRARYNQLWQIVLTKKGIQGGYQSVR
jgi:cyclopropane-fatty-acyl-phospholipid synthase